MSNEVQNSIINSHFVELKLHWQIEHGKAAGHYGVAATHSMDSGLNLIIETKGQYNDNADIKAKAAER